MIPDRRRIGLALAFAPTGYRLRILRVNDLPVTTTYDGRSFEFQLGVSLYDEAYGTFYGNTVGLPIEFCTPAVTMQGGAVLTTAC